LDAPAIPGFPPVFPHFGNIVTLDVVSGWIRDRAGNDASLRYNSALACECPEGPHCVRPIICAAPIHCGLPEICKTAIFCKVPEICAFPEGCKLPEFCKIPETCRIPEFCRNPLFDGCGLPVNCAGLIGRCKGNVDPLPYDPREAGDPSPIDELIREVKERAGKGGRVAIDEYLGTKEYAKVLDSLDPDSRRLVAFHIDGIRKDIG
jgi:hypothetical protein